VRPPSISVDVATQKLVLTVSAPVFRPDRLFAGVTAIDMTMDNMFSGLKIPPALEDKAELFLVSLGNPEAEIIDELAVLMHNRDTDDFGNWRAKVQIPKLLSADTDAFGKMIEDLKAEKSGLRIMEYNGKEAIWVHSGRIGRKAALVMIVPYDVVLRLAEQTQATLLDENIKHLRRAGFLIFAIVAVAAILSFFQAKKFTMPINQLAIAANTLAEGDFSARADIHTGDELQRLAEVFNDLGPKLHEHEKTQRSLALARAIQQNLLPQQAPEIEGFQIAGRCRYCDETGGDYFDFIHLPDSEKSRVGIVLGDVTGHGVGAALLMASARSILRNASLHFSGDLAELMSQFNDQLSEDTGDDKFMTLFYGALDSESRSLTWASGGHDPALWYHREQDAFEELPNTGPLTGYMKNMNYEQAGPITLEAGDILLVGTDGIWEAEDPSGQPYGKERLFEMIRTHTESSAEQMVDAVIVSVEAFSAPVPPSDDVTLIIIKAL
jgi:sigma-B regulation protein RsbU (phosphoserine phosphatase)